MRGPRRIPDLAVAALLERPLRNLVVVAVYATLIALAASLLLYVRALRQEVVHLLGPGPDLVVQRLRGGRHELLELAQAQEFAGIRGVREVTPRVWGYSFDPSTGGVFTVWGADSLPLGTLDVIEGGLPGESGDACLVGHGVAEARFLGVGDRLPLLTADGELMAPRVVGMFSSASALLTNDLVVMSTAAVRRLLGIPPHACTDMAIAVANPDEVGTVSRKVQEVMPDARPVSRELLLTTYQASFDWRSGVWAAFLISVVVAFAILVWDKATGLTTEEAHMIGVLKAVGWTSREILQLKLWEGAIVSSAALLTGVLAAQVHLIVFEGALFTPVLRGWSVLFPALDVTFGLDAYTLLAVVALSVLPYLAASLIPSWRAAVADPDAVLRA